MTRTLLTLCLGIFLCLNPVLSYPNYLRERGPRQIEDVEAAPPGPPAENFARTAGDYDEGVDVQLEPLGLPSNSTSIRANIVDTFSCNGRAYGYYADVDNECQVFHVCLPVTFPDETAKMYKWSFICPQETIFNQESFTCARAEDSVPCQDAATFYSLNENFGKIPEKNEN